MWKGTVAEGFDLVGFQQYVAALLFSNWMPELIVLHNTGEPTLADRPNGFNEQHIQNLAAFYRDEKGWSSGPHLFVDDHLIWILTPLTTSGTHAATWNRDSWGVEMLGDYDSEDFDSGRGALVKANAIAAVALLSARLGIDPDTMRLHREDPKTTHHCPGDGVDKAAFIQAVKQYMGLA
jgi:hypothetical protein